MNVALATEKQRVKPTVLTKLMRNIRRYKIMYLLLVPGLAYFTIFKYVPMFGLILSFKKYNVVLGFWDSPWVGMANFNQFFQGAYFGDLIQNTVLISLYKLVFGFSAPVLLALMLNEINKQWFKRIVQTITYLPHFLSWVIVYGLMLALLSPGEGVVNIVLKQMGYESISFLTSPNWARFLVVASDIWKEIGWGAILYLAALAGIDPSLYESARMDGASKWRQIWHVTLPGIRNVIIVLMIIKLSHILDAGFDQIFMMANVFNQEKIDIIDTWVYREGVQRLQMGIATAVGMFKSLIGLVLVVSANELAKKFDGQIW
ncbi:MAG: sugar transporter ATPase [Paenibacillaceae bacterium]|jgi:putative aldouronate transport system permease protein|nr:sugar transporter ATPase [Paenibacillaceae bacterium]